MTNAINNYISHYKGIDRIYPSAFALKVFLGRFPDFSFRDENLQGRKILDLGFGDGRDIVLFSHLDLEVYGCEPELEVVEHRKEFFQNMNLNAELKTGINMSIPFENNFFDFLYSSAAMYYMPSKDHDIRDAMREANRVIKDQGYLIASFVTNKAHYIPSAEKVGNNLYRLTDPFFKQRNGQLIYAYDSESELRSDLEDSGFGNIRIGKFEVDWFGIPESLLMTICQKQVMLNE